MPSHNGINSPADQKCKNRYPDKGFYDSRISSIDNIQCVFAFKFFENKLNVPSRSIELHNIFRLQHFRSNIGEIYMILLIFLVENRHQPEMVSIFSLLIVIISPFE